jgi:hypothetical protein
VQYVLDEGYSPPERPSAVFRGGLVDHESLDQRLSEELPDVSDTETDGLGDTADSDGELYDDEVGDVRAGRLAEVDSDTPDRYLYAEDVGVDGSAASAEEAAVHQIRDTSASADRD